MAAVTSLAAAPSHLHTIVSSVIRSNSAGLSFIMPLATWANLRA
jgi:hypothetical protein